MTSRRICSGRFLFISIRDKSLKAQINIDSEITKKQFEKDILDDKLEKVLAVIDQKTMWKGVSNESEIKKQLHSKLSKVLDSKKV